jgi:hypothetical protein
VGRSLVVEVDLPVSVWTVDVAMRAEGALGADEELELA